MPFVLIVGVVAKINTSQGEDLPTAVTKPENERARDNDFISTPCHMLSSLNFTQKKAVGGGKKCPMSTMDH